MPPRTRRAPGVLDVIDPEFLGTQYSDEELHFLMEHLGEPSIIAAPEDEELPPGVNEKQVLPLLDRTHQLDLYEQNQREKVGDETLTVWVGFEKLREVIQATLDWRAQRNELKRLTRGSSPEVRRAAGAPSLHMWDRTTDVAYLGGPGADSDIVRTAITEEGNREELFTHLRAGAGASVRSIADVAKFTRSRSAAEQSNRRMEGPSELKYEEGASQGLCSCPICGKSEPYEMNKTSAKRAATVNIMRHLMSESVTQVDAHRLLYTRLKSGRAGADKNRVPARKRRTGTDELPVDE